MVMIKGEEWWLFGDGWEEVMVRGVVGGGGWWC